MGRKPDGVRLLGFDFDAPYLATKCDEICGRTSNRSNASSIYCERMFLYVLFHFAVNVTIIIFLALSEINARRTFADLNLAHDLICKCKMILNCIQKKRKHTYQWVNIASNFWQFVIGDGFKYANLSHGLIKFSLEYRATRCPKLFLILYKLFLSLSKHT